MASLQDEGLREHITANLGQCAAQLHERLRALAASGEAQQPKQQQSQQPPPPQQQERAKRSRRPAAAAVAAAAAEADVTEAEMVEAEEELESLPLIETAAGYTTLAAGAVSGTLDPRFTSSALLLSRKLPAPELVLAHVQRLCAVPPPPEGDAEPGADAAAALQRSQALVAAAGVALGVCAALASEADCPEDALRMFGPALGLLREALQPLQQQLERRQPAEAGEAAGSSSSDPAAVAALQELSQLASRALASMHAALRAQQLRLAAGQSAGGGYWRANPDQPSPAEAADAACAACAEACLLQCTLRLHGSGQPAGAAKQRQQQEALAAAAAADLQLLRPYGTSGLLDYLATLVRPLASCCLQGPACLWHGQSKSVVAEASVAPSRKGQQLVGGIWRRVSFAWHASC